ncbi:MAG: bifunctional oligoribonuclease/PAP phosphatase NrnA [Candidatus Omnitrophota bacterium]|jgi:phosphoesterase RecJ-like protein
MGLQEVASFIKENDNFLVTSHMNVEGDALGSELAFYRLLKALGKKAVIVNEEYPPAEYAFLPDAGLIKRFDRSARKIKFDVFVALDCSDLKRTGEVHTLNNKGKPVLNIDHHVSNLQFGAANLVDAGASSCTEIIFALYKQMRVPLDRQTALLLYVGILTDTGSFRYSNTTSRTHRITAELLEYQLDIPQIYSKLYENIPFKDMQLLSRVLPFMKLEFQGKLVWVAVKKEMLKKQISSGGGFDLSEHILGFARSIKDIEVVVLFKENLQKRNEIRVNFRSQGGVDVNAVARFFGGGGHKTASGATIPGPLDDVRRRVLRKLKSSLQ